MNVKFTQMAEYIQLGRNQKPVTFVVVKGPTNPTDISHLKLEERRCKDCERMFRTMPASKQKFCNKFCIARYLGHGKIYRSNYTPQDLEGELAELEISVLDNDHIKALVPSVST